MNASKVTIAKFLSSNPVVSSKTLQNVYCTLANGQQIFEKDGKFYFEGFEISKPNLDIPSSYTLDIKTKKSNTPNDTVFYFLDEERDELVARF